MKIKKLLGIILLFTMVFTLSACYNIDLNDTSHDDEYVEISTYWALNEESGEVEKLYYIPTLSGNVEFYQIDRGNLEIIDQTQTITYQLGGNYHIVSNEPLNLYVKSELVWENISEIDYIYSNTKLEDDTLITYGDLPIIANTYEIGDTIRVIYQENFLQSHFVLLREDYSIYIRYGDIRELLI